jgi:hypothetical protein
MAPILAWKANGIVETMTDPRSDVDQTSGAAQAPRLTFIGLTCNHEHLIDRPVEAPLNHTASPLQIIFLVNCFSKRGGGSPPQSVANSRLATRSCDALT